MSVLDQPALDAAARGVPVPEDGYQGDYVADLGAGTGLFEPQLAYAVGTRGRVYAVEIDKDFLAEIDRKVDELHISSIETVLGTPTDPKLPMRGIDLAAHSELAYLTDEDPVELGSPQRG